MFQLLNLKQAAKATAILMVLSSCGHSNPEIHGGNTNPIRVKTMLADSSVTGMSDSYSGTLEAGSATALSFSVGGTINNIYVSEGQRVGKGQHIASVDGSSLKHTYDIAQATLREAQDAYNRMKKLHEANALPEMQWVSVQEQLKQAQAAAAIAKTGMDDANLNSPVSGVVSKKFADVGQTIAPGIPIVEIMDVGTLKVKISVPESELANMHKGADATVKIGNRTYSAKLIEKGVAANTLSRNYDIKFRLANPDDTLLPGMICNVYINDTATTSNMTDTEMILPTQAVVLDWDNTSYVWLKKNGEARRQKVDVGGLDSRGIIITGGINATDSVIIEGQQKLSSGLKVTSVN